jgi:IclR family pca regulon transcriptional regulator
MATAKIQNEPARGALRVVPRAPLARPRQRADTGGHDRDFVQGFERGVAVIKAFSNRAPSLTVTQVAERTGLRRAVARRYLLTLEALGYVVHADARYTLTPRVLEIGFTYLSTLTVADVARPFMLHVVATLRESCSVGILDRGDVVYVARMPADRIMTTNLMVGSRLPAHATSMGKVLLAYLPPDQLDAYFKTVEFQKLTERTIGDQDTLRRTLTAVRRRGWAANDEESEKGVRTMAVPLFDRSGQVVAAVNLAGHSSRVTMRELRTSHLPVLQEAAREISRALGASEATLEPLSR